MQSESRLKVVGKRNARDNVRVLRELIHAKNQSLSDHRYFRMCQARELGREQMLEIVKQLYCFSVFFERLLTRRITEYSSRSDPRLLQMAREHLREEIGHAELFRECLLSNGVNPDAIALIDPKMFTKAMFGYLVATIQHENEYVANIAIMQVMESIGYLFFSETLRVMDAHSLSAAALVQHTEADEHHPEMGWEFVPGFDERTMIDSVRVVEDLYRLMGFMLDEWLGLEPASKASTRRSRASTRPARAN
ncbi:MAG: hypothetical protein ACOY0T_14005 [Myxococcota bacterium]